MRRLLIIVVLMCFWGPVQYSKGDNEEAIDREFVVTSLKHYESLIKNYSASYTQTFSGNNPRYDKFRKEALGREVSNQRTKYTSTDIIFENGNWRIEGYNVTMDGEKVGVYIETSNSSQRMLYSPNYERGVQAVPGGLIEKPGKTSGGSPRPCDILFINQKGIPFSSIVEDPNTKVYQINQENRDLIVCEYEDELLNHKVYLDPDNSFAVVKHESYRIDTGDLWTALENIKYIEAVDGIMFPVYADSILYMADEKGMYPVRTLTLEVDKKSLKLNQDLSEDVFTIDFPKGTYIRNATLNRTYRVGQPGDPALDPKPLIGRPLPKFESLTLSSEEIQSKSILVCFWDMNQRPSRNCILQLSKRAQELRAKDVVVIAVQASKIEQAKLDEWKKENNISFPVGVIRRDGAHTRRVWGVRSLPWLILTDTEHIVLAEGFNIDELDGKITTSGEK